MNPIESVRRAGQALSSAGGAADRALTDDDLCVLLVEVEAVGRMVDALRCSAAAEVADRSRPELGAAGLSERLGHRRAAHLLEDCTRVSNAEARRRIRLGESIAARTALDGAPLPPRFPAVASALDNGSLGVDSALRIVAILGEAERTADPHDLALAEAALVDAALVESADLVAVRARVWREYLDPDGAEPRDEARRELRAFALGRERDGLTPCSGTLAPELAALLRSALAEAAPAGPRFVSDDGSPAGTETVVGSDGREIVVERDTRTRAQRHHDVLEGLLTAGVRATDASGAATKPLATVMAVIKSTDLEAGTGIGWLDDAEEPVSAMTVQIMACDAGIRRIALGSNGEVLHLGHRDRYFNAHQRRALAVRDGGCIWPHCTAPPSWCDAHHVVEWREGGRTDIDNGALLCRAHHHMLHRSDHLIRIRDGRPQMLAPPWIDPEQVWRTLGRSRVLLDTG